MATPPPLELTAADLPEDASKHQHAVEVQPLWHKELPAALPGETPAATPRRRVFLWLLGLLVIAAGMLSVMSWLRPAPKPYLVPLWVREYQYHPFHTPPHSKQDQVALTNGSYFTKGRIQLKSLASCAPSDTVALYLSAYAVCSEKGQVLLLPVDADPSAPHAFRPLHSILTVLRDSPAQKKLLILDICWPLEDPYWGQLDAGVAARIPQELDDVPDPQRLVLCSCSPGQVSHSSAELNRSVFSFFLEEGLRGWADFEQTNPERQGLVTVKKLAAFVQARVEQWTRLHQDRLQSPVLYGVAEDFPLVALAKGKPLSHLERASVEKYPDWLQAAWKTRQSWWVQERHRFTPWLFRQIEEALHHAERGWTEGASADALRKDLHAEFERLEKYYQRIQPTGKPEVLSLAQADTTGQTFDPQRLKSFKEFFKQVSEVRLAAQKPEEAPKAAEKIIDEFVEKNKLIPDTAWVGGIFETLATDPFPRRDTIRLGNRLLGLRQESLKYAEAHSVHRLAHLGDLFDDATWPATLVRKALLLTHKGERVITRSHSFPWFANVLENAAQQRHDAESLLYARGYVSLDRVEPTLSEALRQVDIVNAQQEVFEDAFRLLHEALAVLPSYGEYLDFNGRADPTWHETARAAMALQTLLQIPPSNGGLTSSSLNTFTEDLRSKTETLQASMRQLKQIHAPEVIEELLTRSQRPDADVQTYRELIAQGTLPFHAPELRGKLWEARAELGMKITDKILESDTELNEPATRDENEAMTQARMIAVARSARSLALLRLTGLDSLPHEQLQQQWKLFGEARSTDMNPVPVNIRHGFFLSSSLRQTWTSTLGQQLSTETQPALYESVSRIVPGWFRLGVREELLAKAALLTQASREKALWRWLADRYHYASQEPDATPFVTHAVFALRDFYEQKSGFTPSAIMTVADLTPNKSKQLLHLPLRWQNHPKDLPKVSLQVFDSHEDWLQITPDIGALDRLATIPADMPLTVDVPFQIFLKPQAELSAAPRPSGILVGIHVDGRTYHYKIHLPRLPAADRLEILLSSDPKDAGATLGDIRLRPSKERQSFYVYVNNLSEKPRNLIVELRTNDRILPGGSVNMTALPKQATRVIFGTSAVPAKELPPSPPAVPRADTPSRPAEELPELTTALQIRVLDKDPPQEVLTSREIRVDLAHPREYVRVPLIRFEPPSKANQDKNRLEVTVQAARKMFGPPSFVELVIPIERIEGLKAVRTGTFRGEVPLDPADSLKLFASELEFESLGNDTGVVSLTVDGVERAFLFRTTFAPVGEPTTPREEIRPALRLNTGRYYRTNTKFEAAVEVDNAPLAARLQVCLGRWRGEKLFEPEIRHAPLPPRQKRIGSGVRSSDGGIEFDTLLRDWRVPFDAVPLRGERVVEARLLDALGKDLLLPVYHSVHFDDHLPERVAFVNLPKQIKRDAPFLLKATGMDIGTGVSEVTFYLAHPNEDGKFPANVVKFDAKPMPKEPDVWSAMINWPADRKGPTDIAVRFTNKLGLSTVVKGSVELLDIDPEKSKVGTIEGIVREGPRPQKDVAVVLSDEKGNKLAEQKTKDGGIFSFPNLAPGRYVVTASKPTSSRPLTATSKVTLAPGKTERLKLNLFL